MLRARATSVGPWEQYLIGCIEGGGGSFVILSYAEAPVLHYVTAELGYKGKDYAPCPVKQAGRVGEVFVLPRLYLLITLPQPRPAWSRVPRRVCG
jgi:hypothetical protein